MTGRITLITEPDIFENSNTSILLVHLSAQEQEQASGWLASQDLDQDINLYVYDGEPNLEWFFHAMAHCEYKYIDLNGCNTLTGALSGYMLGKTNFYWRLDNPDLVQVYAHISQRRVDQIETFLESTGIGQRN